MVTKISFIVPWDDVNVVAQANEFGHLYDSVAVNDYASSNVMLFPSDRLKMIKLHGGARNAVKVSRIPYFKLIWKNLMYYYNV
jgi:hypothetical protein